MSRENRPVAIEERDRGARGHLQSIEECTHRPQLEGGDQNPLDVAIAISSGCATLMFGGAARRLI